MDFASVNFKLCLTGAAQAYPTGAASAPTASAGLPGQMGPGTRQAGPRLRGPLMENLGAGFFDLFDVVLVADDGQEVQLRPLDPTSRRATKQRTGGRATDDPD